MTNDGAKKIADILLTSKASPNKVSLFKESVGYYISIDDSIEITIILIASNIISSPPVSTSKNVTYFTFIIYLYILLKINLKKKTNNFLLFLLFIFHNNQNTFISFSPYSNASVDPNRSYGSNIVNKPSAPSFNMGYEGNRQNTSYSMNNNNNNKSSSNGVLKRDVSASSMPPHSVKHNNNNNNNNNNLRINSSFSSSSSFLGNNNNNNSNNNNNYYDEMMSPVSIGMSSQSTYQDKFSPDQKKYNKFVPMPTPTDSSNMISLQQQKK